MKLLYENELFQISQTLELNGGLGYYLDITHAPESKGMYTKEECPWYTPPFRLIFYVKKIRDWRFPFVTEKVVFMDVRCVSSRGLSCMCDDGMHPQICWAYMMPILRFYIKYAIEHFFSIDASLKGCPIFVNHYTYMHIYWTHRECINFVRDCVHRILNVRKVNPVKAFSIWNCNRKVLVSKEHGMDILFGREKMFIAEYKPLKKTFAAAQSTYQSSKEDNFRYVFRYYGGLNSTY